MSQEIGAIGSKRFMLINSFIFITLMIIGGILFFALPKDKISVNEKRALGAFPKYSKKTLFNGMYARDIDFYYSDNFEFRNKLISIANYIRERRGIKYKDFRLYTKNNLENQDDITDKILATNNDSLLNAQNKIDSAATDYESINSVVVYKKRAIQIFSGSKKAASNFATMIKKYKDELSPNINFYCMAIPVGSDFYLPSNYSKNNNKEKVFVDYLYSILDPSINRVNAYEEIAPHKNEYIQFNTDHHWTGKGAYYAYQAFCKSAKFDCLALNSFTKKIIPNFIGSLYYYTQSSDLKENKDSVEYYKVPTEAKIKTYYFKEGMTKGLSTKLYAEIASGGNAYSVFLGGDFPLMRVVTEVKNEKKILVLKDSYGNAFVPYLSSHYKEVLIIDYRYFKGNIKELVEKYGITDILFAHNMYTINAGYTVRRELFLLKNKSSGLSDDKKKNYISSKSKIAKDSIR